MLKEVQSCNSMASKHDAGPPVIHWLDMHVISYHIYKNTHSEFNCINFGRAVKMLPVKELFIYSMCSNFTSLHITLATMCASYLWNPATNCGRSVISIFLAIVVPRAPPATKHAAICVITSKFGAMWPRVATMPPLTPICNKTDNITYHTHYDLTFHNLVVTICNIMFNTTYQCTHWSKFFSFSNQRKVYLLTMPRLFPSLEVVWALRPASAPMQHSEDTR